MNVGRDWDCMTSSSTSRRKWYGIGAAAVVLAALAWHWFGGEDAAATTVETESVQRGDLRETISATGALQALQTVLVGTQVSGTIDKIYVDFNSRVKQGQLLALIDPSVLDSQLASAKASLSQATARYNDAVAALEEGEVLLAKNYISDREMRTLKVNVTSAKAQVDSANADYDRSVKNRQYAEIRSPIDGVVIERAVDQGQTVAAGFQTPTLFTIAQDLSQMQIVANVDESQIGSIQLGQAASFAVSSFPAKRFNAEVHQIRLKPTTTQNVVTYSVVLNVNNESGELLPGMTATVDFVLKDLKDVLRVPSSALRIQRVPDTMVDAETLNRMKEMEAARANGRPPGTGEGGSLTPEQMQAFRERRAAMANGAGAGRGNMGSVWVMQADGKAKRVPVRILGSDISATAIEPVRDDLNVGDKVITKLTSAAGQSATATRSLLPGPPGRR